MIGKPRWISTQINRRGPFFRRLALPALLYASVFVFVGGLIEPDVTASTGPRDLNSKGAANPMDCRPKTLKNTGRERDLAWDLLNDELYDCGSNAIEPAWAATKWFGKDEVYEEPSAGDASDPTTLLRFELLLQKRRELSKRPVHQTTEPPVGRNHLSHVFASFPPASSVILFNSGAREDIEKILANSTSTDTALEVMFGREAKVIKLDFRVLPFSASGSKSRCRVGPAQCQVGVFRSRQPVPNDIGPQSAPNAQLPAVTVHADTQVPCSVKKSGVGSKDGIPINCFYYVVRHFPKAEHRVEKDTASPPFEGRGRLIEKKYVFKSSDKIYILLGFHLMKADIPTWTWATYWWTPTAITNASCAGGVDSPLACNAPWSYYAMDAFRYNGKDDPGSRYNPYIEQADESSSNCIYCHARAVYRPKEPKGYGAVDANAGKNRLKDNPVIMLPCEKGAAQVTVAGRTPIAPPFSCAGAIPARFLWSLAEVLEDSSSQTEALRK